MKKRILSFVLALVMAVSLLPVSVLAAEDESEFPYKGTPVVTYTKAGDANESTAVLKRIGTRTWNNTHNKAVTKGKTWLVSLPAGATVNDVNFGETVSQKKDRKSVV